METPRPAGIDVVFDFAAAGGTAGDRQTGSAREDARFLTGAGNYADDTNLPSQAYAYVVRSPHAHARILNVDAGPAAQAPGVLAVLTGNDGAKDGLQAIPQRPVPANPYEVPLKRRDGSPFLVAPHPVLVLDKTRYVGEPVAVVVAETLWQAMDAAERLAVEYDPLPAVVRSADALAPGAALLREEHGTNLCVDSEAGDKAATKLAFARAAHAVRVKTAAKAGLRRGSLRWRTRSSTRSRQNRRNL
jgi:carbon-monoxide dehydrogenase large subunit